MKNSINNIEFLKESNQFQIRFNKNIPETFEFYLPKDDENFLNKSVLANINLKSTDLIEVIIHTINNKEIKKLIEELEKIKTSKYAKYFSINSLEFNNFDEKSGMFKKINFKIFVNILLILEKKEKKFNKLFTKTIF